MSELSENPHDENLDNQQPSEEKGIIDKNVDRRSVLKKMGAIAAGIAGLGTIGVGAGEIAQKLHHEVDPEVRKLVDQAFESLQKGEIFTSILDDKLAKSLLDESYDYNLRQDFRLKSIENLEVRDSKTTLSLSDTTGHYEGKVKLGYAISRLHMDGEVTCAVDFSDRDDIGMAAINGSSFSGENAKVSINLSGAQEGLMKVSGVTKEGIAEIFERELRDPATAVKEFFQHEAQSDPTKGIAPSVTLRIDQGKMIISVATDDLSNKQAVTNEIQVEGLAETQRDRAKKLFPDYEAMMAGMKEYGSYTMTLDSQESSQFIPQAIALVSENLLHQAGQAGITLIVEEGDVDIQQDSLQLRTRMNVLWKGKDAPKEVTIASLKQDNLTFTFPKSQVEIKDLTSEENAAVVELVDSGITLDNLLLWLSPITVGDIAGAVNDSSHFISGAVERLVGIAEKGSDPGDNQTVGVHCYTQDGKLQIVLSH